METILSSILFIIAVAAGLGVMYLTGRAWYSFRKTPLSAVPKTVFVGAVVWAGIGILAGLLVPMFL